MKLLNRSAQRYLLRRARSLPVVGVPGSDHAGETNWVITGESDGLSDITTQSGALRLAVSGEALVLEEVAKARTPGRWRRAAAGDGYEYLASSAHPDRFLGAAVSPDGADADLALLTQRDRSAMWLPQVDCVRDARSVHLRYGVRDQMSLLYNELDIKQAPPGTYFCTSGFGANARGQEPSGYAGIQRRGDGSWRAIFSVWHRMADEINPIQGSESSTVGAHPLAITPMFSGEGSGSSIRLPFEWRDRGDKRVRVLLTATPLGHDTAIAAYFGWGDEPWTHLGVIVRARTNGKGLTRPYTFIEDFLRNGDAPGVPGSERSPYRVRSAQFSNPWCAGAGKTPRPLTDATLTVYSPHPLESIAAGLDDGRDFGINVATGTASATSEPPIGAAFVDTAPARRPPPNLAGIPTV